MNINYFRMKQNLKDPFKMVKNTDEDTNKDYTLTYGIEEFANSFGCAPETFSTGLRKTIEMLNFNYRKPTFEENENLILEALLKIESDT